MYFKLIVLFAINCLFFPHFGECIHCHVCSSSDDGKCADPYDGSFSVDCSKQLQFLDSLSRLESVLSSFGISDQTKNAVNILKKDPTKCYKITYTGNGETHYVRDCGNVRAELVCQTKAANFECDVCDTDNCNHSIVNMPSKYLFILSFIFILINKIGLLNLL